MDQDIDESLLPDVVQRFLRYARVDSPGDPDAPQDRVPSRPEQHAMAQLLAQELQALGCQDVRCDDHAYVTATVPASPGAEGAPALALLAHLDVSHDVPNTGVRPQVARYDGGDLPIGPDGLCVPLAEAPGLARFAGTDVVTSDGTTLLGVDDKGGIAEVMALAARLMADPSLPHPTLRLAFVPDEEIGHGAALLDLDAFGAAYGYTVDGGWLGEVSCECFNAASVSVRFQGTVVHPGDAKDRMVNALTLWRRFDVMLPEEQRPEHTAGREGYFFCESVQGDPGVTVADYVLRDFDADGLEGRIALMERAADFLNARFQADRVSLTVERSYRNMAEVLADEPFLMDRALAALRSCDVEPRVHVTRGGTDGAQLTFRGLPCPNLGTGGSHMHSVREFVPVQALVTMVDVLQDLVARFAGPEGAPAGA